MKRIETVEELKEAVGPLGCSDWFAITQERVDRFADATEDRQWIHVDPERSASGPFGTTVAHGYLTLSLVPLLIKQVLEFPRRAGVNYGLDRVRFPAPVPVGSRIRARVELVSVDDLPGGVQVKLKSTVELEGGDKPACVSETIFRWLT